MFKLLRYTFRYQAEPGNRIARTSTILAVGVFIIWLVRFALQIRESGDPLFSWDFAFAAAYGLGFILLFGFLGGLFVGHFYQKTARDIKAKPETEQTSTMYLEWWLALSVITFWVAAICLSGLFPDPHP
jgi:membrane protease YdiL (CAAX protease family)